MNSFAKTCIAEVTLLAALAVPSLMAGCDRPSDPPIDPRARAPDAARVGPTLSPRAPGSDDAALVIRVRDALRADDDVKSLAIVVAAQNGRVTLHGELAHQAQVARAVEVARQVDGVEAVINILSTPASRRSI